MLGSEPAIDGRTMGRHPADMELRFSYRQGDITWVGSGRASNLSEDAIYFETDQHVPSGADVELRIALPITLQNVCPLELVISGRQIRRDSRGTVLRMKDFEFQTCGERSFNQAFGPGSTCNILA